MKLSNGEDFFFESGERLSDQIKRISSYNKGLDWDDKKCLCKKISERLRFSREDVKISPSAFFDFWQALRFLNLVNFSSLCLGLGIGKGELLSWDEGKSCPQENHRRDILEKYIKLSQSQ